VDAAGLVWSRLALPRAGLARILSSNAATCLLQLWATPRVGVQAVPASRHAASTWVRTLPTCSVPAKLPLNSCAGVDPCRETNCGYYGSCVRSADNLIASCTCRSGEIGEIYTSSSADPTCRTNSTCRATRPSDCPSNHNCVNGQCALGSYTGTCARACGVHGQCRGSTCHCDAGYSSFYNPTNPCSTYIGDGACWGSQGVPQVNWPYVYNNNMACADPTTWMWPVGSYTQCLCEAAVDCVGLWQPCSADCSMAFSITTPQAGNGRHCLYSHGATRGCAPDHGACQVCDGGSGVNSAYTVQIVGGRTINGLGTVMCNSSDTYTHTPVASNSYTTPYYIGSNPSATCTGGNFSYTGCFPTCIMYTGPRTGYDIQTAGEISVAGLGTVRCETNSFYTESLPGNPVYAECEVAAGDFNFVGCEAECGAGSGDSTAYNVSGNPLGTTVSRLGTISCRAGYAVSTVGTIVSVSCTAGSSFVYVGCEPEWRLFW
jgi:hypothetical protein